MSEKFTFFYGGWASQWAACKILIDGVIYNCAEQYMMAMKAKLFNDAAALDIIMGTDNPKVQKAAGRTVQGFNQTIWEQNAKLYVYRANYAKFTQNKDAQQWLMATNGTTLVEASPWDKIWGIGLDANDPKAQDRATWQGTNWLGEIVTQVREDIKSLNWIKAGTDKLKRAKAIGGNWVPIDADGMPRSGDIPV